MLYGILRPMRIENSIEIDAPIARVWDVTLDVESWPDHTSTITSVERLDTGPIAVGSCARVKQPAQRSKVWTVTSLEPDKQFAWATKVMGTTMTGSHVLSSTATGTTNTLTIEIEGALAPIVGALIRLPIRKAIATENEGIKTAAEA